MSEELSSLFSVRFNVSKDNETAATIHPRMDEYKVRYVKSGDQDNRRKDRLDRQKEKRFDAVSYARKLVEGELDIKDIDDITMDTENEDERSINPKDVEKKFNPYKNQLMLSEWVIDPPEDLENKWVMVVCPEGKRLLVVAHKGQTVAYTKSGYALNRFPSLLPGGSYKTWKKISSGGSAYTILDCIFDEANRTFWMLDLMCYKDTPLYDTETSFRFFWLNGKLIEDNPNIQKQFSANPYKFIPCPNVACKADDIANALTDMYDFQVDGALFYHQLCHYTPGRTPLVGWLKPYMIQDILGIPMPVSIMENAPVEFNRDILKQANKKLQHTTSDKSFTSLKLIKIKNKKDEMEIQDTETSTE